MHLAARFEDRFVAAVQGWLGRRGWVPRVEPCTGYGPAGWVRVMCRALLAPPGTPASEVAERDPASAHRAVRGWREVTALPRPLLAAWNGLVLHENARRAVPGMADLYPRWLAAHPDAPTFYLSTGAWNVAPALRRFLERHGYPSGPLLLTDWGPTNTGWSRSGQEHKRRSLHRLMRELPQLRWVLVGDDGQHDPQIHADVAQAHPGRVAVIAIRELTVAEQVLSHGSPGPGRDGDVPREAGAPVVVHGADGNALALALIDARAL